LLLCRTESSVPKARVPEAGSICCGSVVAYQRIIGGSLLASCGSGVDGRGWVGVVQAFSSEGLKVRRVGPVAALVPWPAPTRLIKWLSDGAVLRATLVGTVVGVTDPFG